MSLYFNKPDEAELQKIMEARRNQPDPEETKHKNALELEQAKGQTAVTREQAQVEAARQLKELEMQ
ncbi:hypothetical protein, partial [Pseudoxanthomonas sp. KAs_5_3]|uniref:hypothetical protein n=1 Tax=Pseudoxanthomonas sp. KAs_5_3 TaxID=2067658 RepID=UPI001E59310B